LDRREALEYVETEYREDCCSDWIIRSEILVERTEGELKSRGVRPCSDPEDTWKMSDSLERRSGNGGSSDRSGRKKKSCDDAGLAKKGFRVEEMERAAAGDRKLARYSEKGTAAVLEQQSRRGAP
jgi:hypothetical protein